MDNKKENTENGDGVTEENALEAKPIIVLDYGEHPGEYHFRKPKMGHRNIIVKIWNQLTTASIDYSGAQKVMKGRGLKNIAELAAIPEGQLTPEEVALLMEGVGGDKNMSDIVAVMGDAIFITLKGFRPKNSPAETKLKKFKTLEELDEHLDFDVGMELAQNAILWIKDTVITMKDRKNLQRLSSQK